MALNKSFGFGRECDVFRLHCGVNRDPRQIALLQSPGIMGDAKRLGQKTVQSIANAFAPVAHSRALMTHLVLEEFLAGEVLEIGIVNPAITHILIRQIVNVLQEQKADHEPGRYTWPAIPFKKIRQFLVDPGPVDLITKPHQFVPHVDDLIEAGPEQILRPRSLFGFRSHCPLRNNASMESCHSRKGNPSGRQIARNPLRIYRFPAIPNTC